MSDVAEAAREAIRSLTATPRRFGLMLAVIAAATTVLAVREAQFTRQLRAESQSRIETGEFIYTANYVGDEVNGVPADDCERLAAVPGVAAAGVERDGPDIVLDSHPSGGYRTVQVTPGRLMVAGQQALSMGDEPLPPLLIGSAAAAELGLRGATTVALDSEPVPAVVIEATGPRTGTLDRAVMTIAAPSMLRGTCYVEFMAASPEEAAAILPALLVASVPERLDVRPLISRDVLGPDPLTRFADRPDRYLWAVLVVMTFAPMVMTNRARKNELATYAMFGATPMWISLVLIVESLLLAGVAASIALSVLSLIEPGGGGLLGPAAASAGRYLLWLLLLQWVFAVVLPLRQTRLYELMRKAD